MTGPTTQFKRDLLRGLAWDAVDNSQSLEAALKAAVRAQLKSTDGGLVLNSVTGNSQSFTYALPTAASTLTPETVSLACGQLYDLYEESLAELATDGIASPTDDQIRVRMFALLKPRNAVGQDYSLTRCI